MLYLSLKRIDKIEVICKDLKDSKELDKCKTFSNFENGFYLNAIRKILDSPCSDSTYLFPRGGCKAPTYFRVGDNDLRVIGNLGKGEECLKTMLKEEKIL